MWWVHGWVARPKNLLPEMFFGTHARCFSKTENEKSQTEGNRSMTTPYTTVPYEGAMAMFKDCLQNKIMSRAEIQKLLSFFGKEHLIEATPKELSLIATMSEMLVSHRSMAIRKAARDGTDFNRTWIE
jgi:hypothetical protein